MGDLDRADEAYERAEARFLDAVRNGQGDSDMLSRAEDVAAAAEAWNALAYRVLHESRSEPVEAHRELDWLTERTEVLSELWRDIAAALRSRAER